MFNKLLFEYLQLKTNITFFKIPMKINKSTANSYPCFEKYGK